MVAEIRIKTDGAISAPLLQIGISIFLVLFPFEKQSGLRNIAFTQNPPFGNEDTPASQVNWSLDRTYSSAQALLRPGVQQLEVEDG